MKLNLKKVGIFAIDFLFSFALLFLYFFVLLGVPHNFEWISSNAQLIASGILGGFFATVVLVYTIYRFNATRKTKFDNWLDMNYPKLLLYYVVSTICFSSIDNTVKFSIEELRNMISLEWTIFGITITVFLVWNAIIVDCLAKKKPVQVDNPSPILKMTYIEKKGEFFQIASLSFNNVVFLTIEMFVLICATASTYLITSEKNLLVQNIDMLSFAFVTNGLAELFIDMLKPLKESRQALLEDARVSNEEVEEQNQILNASETLLTTIDRIESSKALTDEQKESIKEALLHEYLGIEDVKQPASDDKSMEEEKNQQDYK